MQNLLNKKRLTITTEHDGRKCDYIQQCLDCRPLFYTLSYDTIVGIFLFLGVDNIKRINEYYDLIHLPQNEARYAHRHIIYNNMPEEQDSSDLKNN